MTQKEGYGMDFGYYWNCIWCIIITMTTVGYGNIFYVKFTGDYFPASLPGRVIMFITSIWGVFIVSMMVVALTNTLQSKI